MRRLDCRGECLLVRVKLACGSTEEKGRLCHGFQTPAVVRVGMFVRPGVWKPSQ